MLFFYSTLIKYLKYCKDYIMKKKDLEIFKKLLLNKRKEILNELGIIQDSVKDSTKEATGNDATFSTHMADQGSDAEEMEKSFYYASRDHKYLTYLNQALERVEKGTYGICMTCEDDIPYERLEAVPTTQKCVPCKMKEKQ